MEKGNFFLPNVRRNISLPIFLIFFLFSLSVISQSTFTVNSTEDKEDIDLADNKCADSNGNCTLRAAIENANKFPDKDKINFKINGPNPHTILLKKNLPVIKETVELNAIELNCYSPDNPQIILNGSGIISDFSRIAVDAPNGLWLTAESSGSTIKGFAIVGFSKAGLMVYSDRNIIQSNLIGLTPNGRAGSRTSFGILIKGTDNLIGGSDIGDKNVISAAKVGVFLYSGNIIMGNYIGTTADGCSPRPNRSGIVLTRYSENNLISNNLISGNEEGIQLSGDNNIIVNNRIGTNAAGTEKIPNVIGIHLEDAVSNKIGEGSNGNLISGNKIGISIEKTNVDGQYNRITNNFVGTDITGNFELGNETGILIKSGDENRIGGFKKGDGNVISGNTKFGIEINGSQETTIAGNYIGTNKTGTYAIPNGGGIKLEGSPDKMNCFNNIITKNLISGNLGNGIVINYAEFNSIKENLLGKKSDGFSPLPNGGFGIGIGAFTENNCIVGTEKEPTKY
ncbi:MAG: NosD domain-containing protein [Bacteroidota bacterium]